MQTQTVGRLKELRERSHASQQELDRAETQLRIAQAALQSVVDERAVRALEYERTKVQLEQRKLRSPIDGIVVEIMKDPGEFVSLSDPVILRLVQLDPLLAVFSTPAALGRSLEKGQEVSLAIDQVEKPVVGVVEFVAPTADPQSGAVRVRVRIPNPDERLPCGVTCRLLAPGAPSTADDDERSSTVSSVDE